MTAQAALGVLSATLSLFGIFAIVYAYTRYSYAKTTIELQNSNIKALSDRQKIQEDEIKELQSENGRIKSELETFKSVPLSQLAESQLQLAELTKVIAKNQQMIMRHLKVS